MPGERTDRHVVALVADVRQVTDPTHVDEHRGHGESQLHERQEAHPTREQLRVTAMLGQQCDGLVRGSCPCVFERRGDHCAPPLAAVIASQTRWGEAGMSMSVMP